jgi:hypothetical protein
MNSQNQNQPIETCTATPKGPHQLRESVRPSTVQRLRKTLRPRQNSVTRDDRGSKKTQGHPCSTAKQRAKLLGVHMGDGMRQAPEQSGPRMGRLQRSGRRDHARGVLTPHNQVAEDVGEAAPTRTRTQPTPHGNLHASPHESRSWQTSLWRHKKSTRTGRK